FSRCKKIGTILLNSTLEDEDTIKDELLNYECCLFVDHKLDFSIVIEPIMILCFFEINNLIR
ncbi:19962_t:CDS:1, partial [Entrophospora sp. SA101]